MRLSQHPICAQGEENLRAGSNPGIVDTIRVKGLIKCHCRREKLGASRLPLASSPAELSASQHLDYRETPHYNAPKGHSGGVNLLQLDLSGSSFSYAKPGYCLTARISAAPPSKPPPPSPQATAATDTAELLNLTDQTGANETLFS